MKEFRKISSCEKAKMIFQTWTTFTDLWGIPQVTPQVTEQVSEQVALTMDRRALAVEFCDETILCLYND